jgi:hypothetical protein
MAARKALCGQHNALWTYDDAVGTAGDVNGGSVEVVVVAPNYQRTFPRKTRPLGFSETLRV